MEWEKLGRILNISEESEQMYSHTMTPVPIHLEGDIYRVIFNSRTKDNISKAFSADINIKTLEVVTLNKEPILELGDFGAFDEKGIVVSSVVEKDDKLHIYYLGFPRIAKELFAASIGVALSEDKGLSAKKLFKGPIKGISKNEPYFSTGPRVLFDKGIYKMWYASCLGWKMEEGKLKHYYHIKCCESANGIDWGEGKVAIDFKNDLEYAMSVPSIIKDGKDDYKMWYSYRAQENIDAYRIGYATSKDGDNWTRRDEEMEGFESASGWDSEMVLASFVFDHDQDRYMLYNGNEYGKTGLGLAKLKKPNRKAR
tara:strand:+ start:444 stop:1379 length:936 start_codon:yes stop_codon:yes gene_type:complete